MIEKNKTRKVKRIDRVRGKKDIAEVSKTKCVRKENEATRQQIINVRRVRKMMKK